MTTQPDLIAEPPASETIECSYTDALQVMEHQRELGRVITCAEVRPHGYRLHGLQTRGGRVKRKPTKPKQETVLAERGEQHTTIHEWELAGWSCVQAQSFGGDVRLVFQRGRARHQEATR